MKFRAYPLAVKKQPTTPDTVYVLSERSKNTNQRLSLRNTVMTRLACPHYVEMNLKSFLPKRSQLLGT
jgi:hypothetical protein